MTGISGPRSSAVAVPRAERPNMRLKLAGAIGLMETLGSCPGGHGTASTPSRAGGPVARSLSAIR